MQVMRVEDAGKREAVFPDLRADPSNVVQLATEYLDIAFVDDGTDEGNPIVIIRIDDGGKSYLVHLSGKNLLNLAKVFQDKYGDVTK